MEQGQITIEQLNQKIEQLAEEFKKLKEDLEFSQESKEKIEFESRFPKTVERFDYITVIGEEKTTYMPEIKI